jgi:hypothetical protein
MDFIEKIFGVSPDGGNGVLEWLYVLAASAAITIFILRWRNKKRRKSPVPINPHLER